MSGKVYVYYELDNFYQNHRRYVNSRMDAQLRNKLSKTTLRKNFKKYQKKLV